MSELRIDAADAIELDRALLDAVREGSRNVPSSRNCPEFTL
ncbi:hypothetical protein [Curtobacterium sp. MCJR17_020]|nr:hypothetical protein [Curtobacterium sp. MCJR17_020]WIE73864.1 hypothetical protein DEJ14_008835 [Curtobacterium sp. MCJR17_020]